MLTLLAGGCATQAESPPHYASLQEYLVVEHRDFAGYFHRDEPDALMRCYADVATRDIPPEIQPALLAAANKAVAGQPLTASEAELRAKWLEARPRPDGNILHVKEPRALEIVRMMVVACPNLRFFNR